MALEGSGEASEHLGRTLSSSQRKRNVEKTPCPCKLGAEDVLFYRIVAVMRQLGLMTYAHIVRVWMLSIRTILIANPGPDLYALNVWKKGA